MTPEEQSGISDRRKQIRRSVYNFLHATATLKDYPTGILSDISHQGAQIILPYDSQNHPVENQNSQLELKTTIENLNTNLAVLIKSVTVTDDNNLRIGLFFTDLPGNPKAQNIIHRICDYGQKLQSAQIIK
jgi:hypothetical protein